MKKSIFLLVILTFTLLTKESYCQNSTQNLDQVKLMKQFVGLWNAKVGADTLIIWECTSFGPNIEFVIKNKVKGVESIEGKTIMGYDVKTGKLLEAIILMDSPNICLPHVGSHLQKLVNKFRMTIYPILKQRVGNGLLNLRHLTYLF